MAAGRSRFEIPELEDIDPGNWKNIRPYQFEPFKLSRRKETDQSETESDYTSDNHSETDLEAEPEPNQERIGNIDWQMKTGRESVCCQEMGKVIAKMGESSQCITEEEDFIAVCTNAAVIETAFNQYLQLEGPIDDEPLNDTYRYVSYRQWTYWIHKKVGRKLRIPLPACAVTKIRERFPSKDGCYHGFEYAH